VQFTHGDDEFSEPTVQTNQNALANVDRGDAHSFWVGQAGCQLPVKPLKVFGLAHLTRHFHSKPPAARGGLDPRRMLWVLEGNSLTHQRCEINPLAVAVNSCLGPMATRRSGSSAKLAFFTVSTAFFREYLESWQSGLPQFTVSICRY
jgi:hypothetical protein